MRYKWFEIIPTKFLDGHIEPDNYQVVVWNKEPPGGDFEEYCFAIAQIYYDQKEEQWELRSYGTRFLTYYDEGLARYIDRYIDLLEVIREGKEDESLEL